MIVLVVAHGIVLLVVQSQAGGVLGTTVVLHGLNEVGALVDNDLVGLGGVVFILEVELIGGELLDRQVGGQEGSVVGHDVGSLCYSASGHVVDVGFVCLSHRYDINILVNQKLSSNFHQQRPPFRQWKIQSRSIGRIGIGQVVLRKLLIAQIVL